MKNFIFKSKDKSSDLYKIHVALELLLTEQRHQRADLAYLIKQINKVNSVPVSEELENIPEEEQ